MFTRTIGAVGAGWAILAMVACGGGGDSSPTPTATGALTSTPNTNLPPAAAVVIFGSPEITSSGMIRVIEAGGPATFYAGDRSRNEASLEGVDLPSDATIFGASVIDNAAAEFDAAYQAAYPDSELVVGVREAYDTVYVFALAGVAANSAASSEIRDHIFYVANSPGQVATFGSEGFAAARGVLEGGGDVNYVGASGQFDLTSSGNISKGQLEVWRLFGDSLLGQEIRDVDLAAEVGADVPEGELAAPAEAPEVPLRIGAILNEESDAAIQNAVQLAVDEINASGGVFGQDVELIVEDAADPVSAAESLDAAEVGAIVGPLETEAALAVADEYANPTSVSVFTLSSAPGLPIDASEGFWRSTASELLETPVMANLAIEAGVEVVCIVHGPNADDLAMAEAFKAAFEHKEGAVRALVELAEGANLQACLGT